MAQRAKPRKTPAAPSTHPAREPRRTEWQSFLHWLRDWAKSLVTAFVVFLFIRSFIMQTYVITSGSMEKTLLVGDLLTLNRAAYGATIPFTETRLPGYADPKRGDVVVFWGPHQPDLELIKRMMGVPGDTLQMRQGILYVNGKALREPYAAPPDPAADVTHPWMVWQAEYLAPGVDRNAYHPTLHNWGPIVVPPGRYFMMGDNRDNSLDSRYWGFVRWPKIKGRAAVIYYSYEAEKPSFLPILHGRWNRIGRRIR